MTNMPAPSLLLVSWLLPVVLGGIGGGVVGAFAVWRWGSRRAEELRQTWVAEQRAETTAKAINGVIRETERCLTINQYNSDLQPVNQAKHLIALPTRLFEQLVADQIGQMDLPRPVVAAMNNYLKMADKFNPLITWSYQAYSASDSTKMANLGMQAQREALQLCPQVATTLQELASTAEARSD